MQPLAIDPHVLRALLTPDIKIVPGRAMMARVVAANPGGKGALAIAGFVIDAELPKDVRTGDDLRLVVREVTPERVLLSLSDDPRTGPQLAQTQTPQPPPGVIPVPVPHGGTLQVSERDAHGGRPGDGTTHSVALRYTTPSLGPVDLHFTIDAGALSLAVSVAPGPVLELARQDAENLRRALAEQLQRAVTVAVRPRREPLELYA